MVAFVLCMKMDEGGCVHGESFILIGIYSCVLYLRLVTLHMERDKRLKNIVEKCQRLQI